MKARWNRCGELWTRYSFATPKTRRLARIVWEHGMCRVYFRTARGREKLLRFPGCRVVQLFPMFADAMRTAEKLTGAEVNR